MMVASYSFRHLVLLALCIVLTSFSSEVSAIASSKGGKGRSRSGRYDDTFSYNPDPEEENVDSPPVDIARFEPTAAPSGKPSQTPMCDHASELPSISPTTFHSLSPSATPTDSSLPTVAPSSLPTISAAPSKSHAPTTSSAPSQSPAPSQSAAPSVSASPSVSTSPTGTATPSLSFAPTTSNSPTVGVCATNPDGFFGDATNDGVLVSYGYELEYKLEPGLSENDVVANLENSFNNFLLPFLFPSDCPTVGRRTLVVHRRLETVGVSKRPDDQPLPGVSCSQQSNPENDTECVVMDGQLTIYTNNGTPSTTEEQIQNQLKTGMENGDFVEGPVVRVSYVDLETDPDSNTNGGTGGVDTQGGTSRRGTAIGVVAAIASFLILALALAWRRKKQQQHEESVLENGTTLDGETTGDV